MERVADKVWVYWFITDVLLILEVLSWQYGLTLALILTSIQVVHFGYETRSLVSFPTQVRMAYALLLLAALWPSFYWLIYPVILGTTAMVVFDYCFLARFMSLMPWNHRQPYAIGMIWRTFFSKPVAGSVQKN